MYKLIKKAIIFILGNMAYFLLTTVALGIFQVALSYGNQRLYLVMFILGSIYVFFVQYLWKGLDKLVEVW